MRWFIIHYCLVCSPDLELRSGQKQGLRQDPCHLARSQKSPPKQPSAPAEQHVVTARAKYNESQAALELQGLSNKCSGYESRIIRNRLKQTIEQQTEFA